MKIGATQVQNLSMESLQQMTEAKGFSANTKIRGSGNQLYGSNAFSGFNSEARNEKRMEAKKMIADTFRSAGANLDEGKKRAFEKIADLISNHKGEFRGENLRLFLTRASEIKEGKIVDSDQTIKNAKRPVINEGINEILGGF